MGFESADVDIRSHDVKTQDSSGAVSAGAVPGLRMKQIAVENGYFHGKNALTYRYFYSKVGAVRWMLGSRG